MSETKYTYIIILHFYSRLLSIKSFLIYHTHREYETQPQELIYCYYDPENHKQQLLFKKKSYS